MRRLLIGLFACNLLVWSTANGLLPLLPLRAQQLGATATVAGIYMALAYASMAAGTLLVARLAQCKAPLRGLLFGASVQGAAALFVMGRVADLGAFVMATCLLWCAAGAEIALISSSAAALSENRTGGMLGSLAVAVPLGALLGGVALGASTMEFGYAGTFLWLAACWSLQSLVAWGGLGAAPVRNAAVATRPVGSLQRPRFLTILLALLLLSSAMFVGRLGTVLAMRASHMSSAAILSVTAIGGLVALPAVPLLGLASDRFGRTGICVSTSALLAAGMLVLTAASASWHYQVAGALLSVAGYSAAPVFFALIAEVHVRALQERRIAQANGTIWLAGTTGFLVTGVLFDSVGAQHTFFAGATLAFGALICTLVLWRSPIRQSRRKEMSAAQDRARASVPIDIKMDLNETELHALQQTYALFALVAHTATRQLFVLICAAEPLLCEHLCTDLPVRRVRLMASLKGMVDALAHSDPAPLLVAHGTQLAHTLGQSEQLTDAASRALDEVFHRALGRAYTVEARYAWHKLFAVAGILPNEPAP